MDIERGTSMERLAAGVIGGTAVFGVTLWLAAYDAPGRTSSQQSLLALVGVVAGLGLAWGIGLGAGLWRGHAWARSAARGTAMVAGVVALIALVDTIRRVSGAATANATDAFPPAIFLIVSGLLLAIVPPAPRGDTVTRPVDAPR